MCLLFITFSKVINMFIKFLVTKKYRSDCNPFIKSSIFNREKKKKKPVYWVSLRGNLLKTEKHTVVVLYWVFIIDWASLNRFDIRYIYSG